MKNFLAAAICLGLMSPHPTAAQSQPCFMGKLRNSSNAFISVSNGFVYLVVPGRDRVTAGQWTPLDKLQICRGKGSASLITNLTKTPPATITGLKQN